MITGLRIAALAAVLACSQVALATPDPAKVKVSPSSKQGVLLLRAPVLTTTYHLEFRRENKGGWSGYEPVFIHAEPKAGPRYIAIKLKPGRWALTALSQQLRWNTCYWKDVPTFEIRPGRITFIGEYDGQRALQQLGETVVRRGHTVSQGLQYFWYWDDTRAPPLHGGDDPTIRREAEAFAREGMRGALVPFADPAFAKAQKPQRPGSRC